MPRLAKLRYIKRVPFRAMPYALASRSNFPLSLASPHIYPTLHRLRQPSANRLQGRSAQGLEPHKLYKRSRCVVFLPLSLLRCHEDNYLLKVESICRWCLLATPDVHTITRCGSGGRKTRPPSRTGVLGSPLAVGCPVVLPSSPSAQ